MDQKEIGLATFNTSHPLYKEVEDFINKDPREIQLLQRQRWNQHQYDFFQSQLEQYNRMFKTISRCQFTSVCFRSEGMKSIPEGLLTPQYQKLILLNLNSCSLVSIQSLAFLKANDLKILILSCNDLTNLSPLNKTNFPNLESLQFKQNKLRKLVMSRIRTKAENCVLSDQFDHLQIFHQDLSFLSKYQAKNTFGRYYHDSRIWQEKVSTVLGSKLSMP